MRTSSLLRLPLIFSVVACFAVLQAQQQSTPPAASSVPADNGAAGAGRPQQPVYALKLDTKLVDLDVVVTDRKGNLVTNLTKNDFQVLEDKHPQEIRSLDQPGAQQPAVHPRIDSTAELDRLEPHAPVSIIVIDELVTKTSDQAFVLYSLKRYLKSEGDELAQPTMLVAAGVRRFMVLRDYTTSRKAILEALNRHFSGGAWVQQAGISEEDQFNGAFRSLIQVAEATAGHPGHKNMIWIGRGFPQLEIDQLPDDDQLLTLVRTATNMLRDARVTMYTVDPGGVLGLVQQDANIASSIDHGSPNGRPFGDYLTFESMAWETGGRAFYGRNDVDHLIETSVREGQTFYTLTYKPESANEDPKAFRRIRVVMKDPNLTATAREGYYAATAPPEPEDQAKGKFAKQTIFDLVTASQGLLIYDGVGLQIVRDPATPDSFVIKMRAADLVWTKGGDGKQTSAVTLLIESHDIRGKLVARSAKVEHIAMDSPSDGSVPRGNIALPAQRFSTAAPVARLRFVVRAENSGAVGAQNVFLIDPKTLRDPATGMPPVKAAR